MFDTSDVRAADVWEDYAYACKLSGAHRFLTLAFEIVAGPGDAVWLLDTPWERRIFTITIGAANLDPTCALFFTVLPSHVPIMSRVTCHMSQPGTPREEVTRIFFVSCVSLRACLLPCLVKDPVSYTH